MSTSKHSMYNMKQYIMGSADESKVVKNRGIHTKYCLILTKKNAKKL